MSKETFIVRTEWMDAIMELSDADRLCIYDNLFYYHSQTKNNQINLNNLSVKLVWKLIEPNLKRNIEAYDERRNTSKENGKLGGRPKTKNNLIKPNKPNVTLSVPVSVSVPVLVPESVSEPDLISNSQKFASELETFDIFRKLYPGSKRGNETEFYNFKKQHKTWKLDLPNLLSGLQTQINARKIIEKAGGFLAQWKNLSTYINGRWWEQEMETEGIIPFGTPNKKESAADQLIREGIEEKQRKLQQNG